MSHMTLAEIRKHPDYAGAVCSKKKLCDFVLVVQDNACRLERCTFCGKKMAYRIIEGKLDQSKYGRDHVRDYLQPGGQAYEEIYGSSWRKRKPYQKSAPTHQEIVDQARDVATTLQRLEDKGYRVDRDKIF